AAVGDVDLGADHWPALRQALTEQRARNRPVGQLRDRGLHEVEKRTRVVLLVVGRPRGETYPAARVQVRAAGVAHRIEGALVGGTLRVHVVELPQSAVIGHRPRWALELRPVTLTGDVSVRVVADNEVRVTLALRDANGRRSHEIAAEITVVRPA